MIPQCSSPSSVVTLSVPHLPNTSAHLRSRRNLLHHIVEIHLGKKVALFPQVPNLAPCASRRDIHSCKIQTLGLHRLGGAKPRTIARAPTRDKLWHQQPFFSTQLHRPPRAYQNPRKHSESPPATREHKNAKSQGPLVSPARRRAISDGFAESTWGPSANQRT
jgi:hypothetical protein